MIKINEIILPHPKDFRVEKESIFAGEYTSQTGKQFADVVGWRYAPTTLSWEILQDSELQAIQDAGSTFTVTFTDPKLGEVTTAARLSRYGTTHKRNYWGNRVTWVDFSMEVVFIDSFTN